MSQPPREQQRRIPFTRDARLKLLGAINPAIAGVSRRSWINIAELLTQVELCTGRDGCFSYCETLYDRMFGGRGIPRSTFFRVRQKAGELGLLIGDERYARNGKTSNEWRVNWDQVGALAARSGTVLQSEPEVAPGADQRAPASETDRFQTGTDRRQTGTDRSQSGTDSIRGLIPSSVRPIVPTTGSTVDKADDQKNGTDSKYGEHAGGAGRVGTLCPPPRQAIAPPRRQTLADPAAIRGLAERIERGLDRRCRNAGDWLLAVKAAMLVERFGEEWLWSAVNGVLAADAERRKRGELPIDNRWSYFTRVLQDATRKLGKALNRELAKTTPPPDVVRYDGGAWREAARMCDGGEL
ncbi:hypothetical protein [Lacipirellula sp.]|uniref:hypothetical protein n=1 Tax=Lacipirellula sp. TaxID=2691419 RepID=UPI003D0C1814